MDDDDDVVSPSSAATSPTPDGGGEQDKRRSKKKKKKSHSASPSKSRGPLVMERIGLLVVKARVLIADWLPRLSDYPRNACTECRTNVRGSLKRAALIVWILIILLSLLNLLGLAPSMPSFQTEAVEPTELASEEPVAEEIIVQKLPAAKSQKVNLAMERDFGCRELECIAQCNGKAKPKCLKSRSCVIERDKICQKRCRKARYLVVLFPCARLLHLLHDCMKFFVDAKIGARMNPIWGT